MMTSNEDEMRLKRLTNWTRRDIRQRERENERERQRKGRDEDEELLTRLQRAVLLYCTVWSSTVHLGERDLDKMRCIHVMT